MGTARGHEPEIERLVCTDAGTCYGWAWRILRNSPFDLLLILIVSFIAGIPCWTFLIGPELSHADYFYRIIFGLAYEVAVMWPVQYGMSYAFLGAVRGKRPEIAMIGKGFKNWPNVLLAEMLRGFIIASGFFLLILPGIFFACRLVFVPYLVLDGDRDPVQAVQESWRMTKGHTFTVFFTGLLGFFIVLAGFALFVVGLFPAILWIKLAFAALYMSLSDSERPSLRA